MKRAFEAIFFLALGLLASCGTPEPPPTGPVTSGLSKRVLITDSFPIASQAAIRILDAELDAFGPAITAGGTVLNQVGLTRMLVTPDKSKTLVYDSVNRRFLVVNNDTEEIGSAAPTDAFADTVEDFVILPDNNTVFVAVRNAPVSGQPVGAVLALDVNEKTVSATIPVPHVRRLALSPNGSRLLAFADDSNSAWVIDTSAKTATRIDGLDRPFFGVVSADNARAFILNCGPECGGTSASVTVLDLATNTLGATVPVSAATVAALDGTNLYVAGNAAGGGVLDVINTGSLTVSKSGVAIGDGFHYEMTLAADNKLFIAAQNCSTGCLSIFDRSGQTAVVSTPAGDVTAMQPITDRSVVYVIEDGELVIYDTSTSKPQEQQVQLLGQPFGVALID